MLPPELPPPTLIQDDGGLEALLADLERQEEIAVDTEADSFYSYREKVCLIQITVEDRDYLVDPLAGIDLAPLGRFLADPVRTKVFHDGEYDVSILKRDFGFSFAGLFDTRVAAAALGVQSPGLAAVLAERFGVELDKSMQRSNWAQRPLSEKQVRYARLDTHFLLPLMHALSTELDARGRRMIVEGECRRIEALEPFQATFHPDDFVRVKGVRWLVPKARRVLRELFILREKLAADSDEPPFRVMNNPLLVELAKSQPPNARALASLSGFSPRMMRRYGERVLETLARAREMPGIDKLPRLARREAGRLDDVQVELYDRLKRWRKSVADEQGIEAAYLLNRHVMARIAEERPRTPEALARVEGLMPWQLELYQDDLLGTVALFEKDLAAGRVPTGRPWRRSS